jgi:hypothetical protein
VRPWRACAPTPCLEAFQTGRPVINVDLGAAGIRWPKFAPGAAALGFQSVHAFPLRLRQQVIGAMNVFGATTPAMNKTRYPAARPWIRWGRHAHYAPAFAYRAEPERAMVRFADVCDNSCDEAGAVAVEVRSGRDLGGDACRLRP